MKLNVTLEINLEISDEAAFRADAIEQLSRFDGTWDPDSIEDAIADAKVGGWDFIQEILFITSLLPNLNGVAGSDEAVSRPALEQIPPKSPHRARGRTRPTKRLGSGGSIL